jgi:hypothetical protein
MESGPCSTCPNAIGVVVSAAGRYRTCSPENWGRCVALHRYNRSVAAKMSGLQPTYRQHHFGIFLRTTREIAHLFRFAGSAFNRLREHGAPDRCL